MHLKRRAVTVLVGLVLAGASLLVASTAAQASSAPSAHGGTSTAPVTASGGQVVVNAGFDAAQSAQLRAYLNSAVGQARVSAHLGTVVAASPGMRPAFEGGRDGNHWWIKVSAADIVTVGIGVACRAAFPGVGWFVCPPLTAALRAIAGQFPSAHGFWAELYDSGYIRVGACW
jgi:hypothetical protein